jgi:Bacterial PH domain
MRFRPVGVLFAAIGFTIMLLVTMVAVWLTLPQHTRDSFTPVQRLTVFFMVGAALVVGHAMVRCRVDADEDGLTVVNGYRTHRLEWGQVVEVTLRPGNPWAVLDLSDGTTCSAMGIQGSDGARARRQARQLRDLVEAHAGTDPLDG